jgi:hypothetical protein
MDQKANSLAPFVACAVLMVLMATYVGGYFWLSTTAYGDLPSKQPLVIRICRYAWLANVYVPLRKIEKMATGAEVVLGGQSPTLEPEWLDEK